MVDAIQVAFNTTREALRAFDRSVMVAPNWNEGFDHWIMLPSGEREFCYDDWIVRNEAGRLFFCDAETFAADYTDISPYLDAMEAWEQVFRVATGLTDSDFHFPVEAVTFTPLVTDLTPYITDMNEAAAELAAASTTPFDFRKDIYLGGIV